MNILRDYVLASVTFIATLVLTLIAIVAQFGNEITYLTFAMGATITLAVTLLEKSIENAIQNEIGKKLKLYELLDKIDDQGLQDKVIELATELSRGSVPHSITALRSRELLANVQYKLQASEYSRKPEGVYEFQDNTRRRTWYDGAIKALERGVIVEQTFILKKEDVVIDGRIDQRTLEILQEHSNAGIEVRILWYGRS